MPQHSQRKWQVHPGKNRFCCKGHIMMSKQTGVFHITVALIIGTCALFFGFDCPFLTEEVSPAIPVIAGVLCVFVLCMLFRTSFTDPGVIPRATNDEAADIERQIEVPNGANSPTYRPPPRTKEVLVGGQVVKLKYCFTCKIFRPPRASHCSICDNCVGKYNSSCTFIANYGSLFACRARNYRYFYCFIVSLAFLCVFLFACAITHLVLLARDRQFLESLKESPASVLVAVICFLSIWSVLGLAGFHTYLTTSNQTTNEDIKGSFSGKRGAVKSNPYSQGGVCMNCLYILCGPVPPSLLEWNQKLSCFCIHALGFQPGRCSSRHCISFGSISTRTKGPKVIILPQVFAMPLQQRILLYVCLGTLFGGVFARSHDDAEVGDNSTVADHRQEKFFSLFTIIKFANTNCYGTNSFNGTCMTAAECTAAGGTVSGSCASGFGVCCTIIITKCGQTTNKNCTYFQNPGTSTVGYSSAGQCMINIQKCSDDICQLRVDFMTFTISQNEPHDNKCLLDTFTVSGASNNVPAICVYLDAMPGTNAWSLGFILSGTNMTRYWNLKMSQIPCDSRLTAPHDCLQYFTEPTGTITSFNYKTVTVATGGSGRQLSNQDYSICIRRNQGFCGICYSACTDSVNTVTTASFTISGLAGTTASTSLADTDCLHDWLQIPCATDKVDSSVLSTSTTTTPVSCVSRLCGVYFNAVTGKTAAAPVYSYSPSFELRFHTDSTEGGSGTAVVEESNMGFCLNYVQQSCASTNGLLG
nr:EOG090X01OT [Lepidurus arcticus]